MRWATAWMAAAALLVATAAAAQSGPVLEGYKTVGERALQAHVFGQPDDIAHPAVLLVHGGGWSVGEPEWTYAAARILQRQGLVSIPVEYRLSGDGVTPADALADVCDAFDWARANAGRLRRGAARG